MKGRKRANPQEEAEAATSRTRSIPPKGAPSHPALVKTRSYEMAAVWNTTAKKATSRTDMDPLVKRGVVGHTVLSVGAGSALERDHEHV